MSCIKRRVRFGLVSVSVIAGCASSPPSVPAAAPTASQAAAPPARASTVTNVSLAPPGAVRSWAEVRLQAAHRLMVANPAGTYGGVVVQPLLAIPVLEVELNGDGSIRKIEVLRQPRQALDTVQLAIDAVRRAAPFGDVSRLPKPWRFTETFLFNEQRKFKPRTLDQ